MFSLLSNYATSSKSLGITAFDLLINKNYSTCSGGLISLVEFDSKIELFSRSKQVGFYRQFGKYS